MRVVGCFLEYGGKFVLLYRHSHKPEGDTWGMPGGKVEPNETDDQAMIRELQEETGYISDASELQLLGEYEFTSPMVGTYQYVTYRVSLKDVHDVQLEQSAHSDYKWVSVEEADKMDDLISGLHDLFRMVGYIT